MLGWHNSYNTREEGFLYFENPGETVLIKVTNQRSGQEKIYEAMPVGGSGNLLYRFMVEFIDDGDAKKFTWPMITEPFFLSIGQNHLSFTVVKVGSAIKNEDVLLQILPGIPRTEKEIYLVWVGYFWPIWAVILILYAINLLWITYKKKNR